MNPLPHSRLIAFLLLTPFAGLAVAAEDSGPPNVLLIIADDLGFSDLGCYGGEIDTPHLDSLAADGLRYTQFYNTGRCWPTRSSLLAGYYAQQIRRDILPGVPSGGGGSRPQWAALLPELLKPAGYRSYQIGKWHVDGMPCAEGFDRSYYLKDQSRFFHPTQHYLDDARLPAVAKDSGFYGTIELADRAIEFLQQHHREHADQPFFAYLAFAAPHFPLHALPEDIAKYEGTYHAGWDQVRAQRWQKMKSMGLLDAQAVKRPSPVEADLGPPYHFPESLETLGEGEINRPVPWKQLTAKQKHFQARKMAIHAAMVDRMDAEIGRVLSQIDSMGQRDNTLIMFLSDNGASAEIMVRADGHDPEATMGSAETYLCLGPGWSTTSNTPFRRHKTWTHEGGISTPLIVSWPSGIKAAGEFRRQPGHVIDVAATLLDLADASLHPDAPEPPGQSLVRTFTDTNTEPRKLWWFHDGHRAIREGNLKAVSPIQEPWELYDLASDRTEQLDLAIAQHERLEQLTQDWQTGLEKAIALATTDLSAETIQKAQRKTNNRRIMNDAQQAALPQRTQVLLSGKTFFVAGRHAFLMAPDPATLANTAPATGKPWVLYAPALGRYPDQAESWMHEKFLAAGVAVAGIDVGEAYGSPHALRFFEALFDHMVSQGYSTKPVLLGRSRGGLWAMRWAIEHPDRTAGLAGIYPAYDYTTYPGVQRAATAYGVDANVLETQQEKYNPIQRAATLAKSKIPVKIIHGVDDQVVPLAENSGQLETIYTKFDQAELIDVIKVPGQGHSFWEGFFQCQPLVDFVIQHAKGVAP